MRRDWELERRLLVQVCLPGVFVAGSNNSVTLVRERTIPTERPLFVCEVNANFLWIEIVALSVAADPLRPYSLIF
jgi:hypothetical protein